MVATDRLRTGARCALLVLLLASGATPLAAQGRRRGFQLVPGAKADDFAVNNIAYDGRLTWVRLRFTPARTGYGGGGGYFGGINYQWDHDYPRADTHIMTIMDEMTSLLAHADSSNIFSVTDTELSRYPIAYMVEPGFWTQTPEEAAALRNYLLKGGFLIVDDFADYQLVNFQERMREVLPDGRLVEVAVEDPIFHAFFDIDSLNYQHPYYGLPSHFLGIYEDNDRSKRLMVIVNYNNDIGEYWEWSDSGFIPIPLTNEGFKLGVNYLVYALTH